MPRNVFIALCMAYMVWCMAPGAGAQDGIGIDEDALFADTSVLVDIDTLTSADTTAATHATGVSLSGEITGSVAGSLQRDWFLEDMSDTYTHLQGVMLGHFYGDIRLPREVKSFVNVELRHDAAYDSVSLALRELFLDWHIARRVYWRVGTQVLQWGRGYFFTPVDLVNVEKVRFFDELADRQGTAGIRVHVPFGTTANIYAFADLHRASHIDSVAGALKAEFLAGATEFAFSLWGKPNTDPVGGVDVSTRLGDFSVIGEAALHTRIDTFSTSVDSSALTSMLVSGDLSTVPIRIHTHTVRWAPRISLGAGRYFDFGNINDRIMVNAEAYYNHAGSAAGDMLAFLPTELTRSGSAPVTIPDSLLLQGFASMPAAMLQPNTIAKWYAAGFCTISRFVMTDMTATTSVLYNINQKCAMLTGAVTYSTLHNLSFDLRMYGFTGRDYTEYAMSGQGLSVELRAGILF